MAIHYAINGWMACAPGLVSPDAWQAWARSPEVSDSAIEAPLMQMAPLLRRRLAPLGRLAVQAAWDCQRTDLGMPVVLASRHGDAERALRLLKDFALGAPMSPSDFTLSVHNAIGAIYSIARGDTAACTSIAAGATSAAAGLIEAVALLADGAPEVLLVCYDAPLPGAYAEFDDEPVSAYAWAWRLGPADADQAHFSLSWSACEPDAATDESPLPFGLDAHRFVVSGTPSLTRCSGATRWTWSRHARVA